jgi:acyl-CoA thioesterase FadM
LLDWKIEVIESVKMGEELRVDTWIEPLKSPFGTIRSFLGYVGDKLCAKGITKWVLLDVTTGRPSNWIQL